MAFVQSASFSTVPNPMTHPPASPGLASQASQPASPGLASQASQPASPGLASQASQPISAGLASQASQPISAGLASQASQPISAGLASQSSQPASAGLASQASQPISAGLASQSSQPVSAGLASQASQEEDQNHESIYQHFTKLVSALPSRDGGIFVPLYRHPDGWHASLLAMVGAMVAQQHFKARSTDVLLASFPKSGTTWLKALLFATINRSSYSNSKNPFTTLSPHQCIPFLETQVYANDQIPDLDVLPSPRLFSTHIPFQSLPQSVLDSGCRIVYICRNPKDNFVSFWHFISTFKSPSSLEENVGHYCEGISLFGPYWDHLLGYWKGHLERPQNVLFLKYEEMMLDPVVHLKRLAEFVGFPFTPAEEKEGVVEGIVRLCAFENLRGLEVNKIGKTDFSDRPIENSAFFRRGVVGDWVNCLSPEMVRRLDEMIESKFRDSGLTFLEPTATVPLLESLVFPPASQHM